MEVCIDGLCYFSSDYWCNFCCVLYRIILDKPLKRGYYYIKEVDIMYKEEVIDTYKRIINSRGYKEFKLTRNELITKICHKVGASANNKNIAKVRKMLQEVE